MINSRSGLFSVISSIAAMMAMPLQAMAVQPSARFTVHSMPVESATKGSSRRKAASGHAAQKRLAKRTRNQQRNRAAHRRVRS